eukprot:scaffold29337_cov18-Prasinocladus_malaysianus.AAC.1
MPQRLKPQQLHGTLWVGKALMQGDKAVCSMPAGFPLFNVLSRGDGALLVRQARIHLLARSA